MSGELWGFCGAIVTAIITLIGVIIGVSVKRPKVKNTDEIKSDTLDIKNQIGENKNTSLIRDHQEIINKIEKNLENNDSIIISQLKNINDFTEKSKFNREVLDKEIDYLKAIEEQRVKDKLMLKELKANYIELNKDNISLKKELEDKNKEIKILKLEIRNLNDKNQEPSF
ncbi:hypothetical protein [Spiroplasma floricola]|nr:hypothetical protein [Spiroplasma floricola]